MCRHDAVLAKRGEAPQQTCPYCVETPEEATHVYEQLTFNLGGV